MFATQATFCSVIAYISLVPQAPTLPALDFFALADLVFCTPAHEAPRDLAGIVHPAIVRPKGNGTRQGKLPAAIILFKLNFVLAYAVPYSESVEWLVWWLQYVAISLQV